jgi:hypothetical protein
MDGVCVCVCVCVCVYVCVCVCVYDECSAAQECVFLRKLCIEMGVYQNPYGGGGVCGGGGEEARRLG